MSKGKLHPDVTREEEGFGISTITACTATIWGVVIIGYCVNFAIEQYYGYTMSYGMIVFLVPAIIMTIIYIIHRIIGPWWAHRHPEVNN
ncbi:MAG: hypothetical protein E4H14_11325 [Candidatus Thorarchaeota archaeon]|nr:MAG: hypothetical protein E4H14_11325 [Candidatus Thorarchaeota archaeon]